MPIGILIQLKEQGARITKARKVLAEVFDSTQVPLSELELRQLLSKRGVVANKTTVYRELVRLQEKGFVRSVELGDGKKRYEKKSGHHHHLVCTSCNGIEDIVMENDLATVEKKISKQKNFKITAHALEFFGVCGTCSRNK